MRAPRRLLASASALLAAAGIAVTVGSPKPPPPSATIPSLLEANPPVLCVGCDDPFDTTTHKELLIMLVGNQYVAELRMALYLQDSLHQFESKAHFDNCDFDSSIAYINALLDEAGKHVEAAEEAKRAGNATEVEQAARRAFFAIGQALHGVQDFYAHTNYLELQIPHVTSAIDLEVIPLWRPQGRARIKELQSEGLVSGFVFWGFPQKCPKGTASHAELAKDSIDTKSGARMVSHLRNLSQYNLTVLLAREASLQLMTDAFRRWPLLKELNGPNVAFEIQVDRRAIEER